MFKNIVLALIPMFVAVDPVGLLPMFVGLTEGFSAAQKRRVILQSMITAVALAVGFIFIGKQVFKWLGITNGDFMVAGGVVLFCFAMVDLVNPVKKRRVPGDSPGPVPLGTPLMVGPGVMATSMLIVSEYGLPAALVSVIVNILLAGVFCWSSGILINMLGEGGTKAISKIVSLLLAAIAVMLIRKGLGQFLG
ncbi:MAG: MarC family protein [Planctomycetales bacterium]|nr:MarC family protein [Planctomycetales bacterium]